MQKGLDFHVFYTFYGNGGILRSDKRYYDIFIKINFYFQHIQSLNAVVAFGCGAIKCNYLVFVLDHCHFDS